MPSSTFATCKPSGPAWLLWLLALVMLAACATPRSEGPNVERLERELNHLERRGFAGQVAVVSGDRTLLLTGHGRMSPDDLRKITPEAVMPLASLTKPFTASAVLALAAEGRIGLNDPVGDHVPDLSPAWAAVPIRHFLTHTAGLPAEIVNRAWEGEARFEPIERDELIRRINHFEPDHPPGAGFNYSNVGYNLLAVLIEVVGEQGWEDLLRGSLLATAGVDGIGFLGPGWSADQLVSGRERQRDRGHYFDRPRLPDGLGWHLRGAGDLMAHPGAIIAWWQAIRRGTWLSEPWLTEWLTPKVLEDDGSHYGYGLHFRDTPYGPVIGHTGGDFVFAVDLSWFTDHDLMVYIATADPRFEADTLRDRLHHLLLGP